MVKSFPGVRTKECIRNNKKDIYFSIRYTRNGKQYEESIGYKSEGFTAAQAYEILSELKRDIKTGKALSLREKTEQREQEKIANEAANMTFSELFEEYYQPHIQNKDKKSTYDREVHLYKKWLSSPEDLIQAIYLLFIKDINIDEGGNFIRLKDEKARKFYQMILTWKINNTPYNQMINYFLNYWDTRIRNNDPIIYVGSTWGGSKSRK